MSFTHEHQFTVAASPAVVFDALTRPEALTRWFAESVEVGRDVGEPFRFWGRHTLGTPSAAQATQRITQWEPGARLGFSWTLLGIPTHVQLGLSAQDGATRLAVQHTIDGTLPLTRPHELIDDHWRFVVGNLMMYCEGGEGIVLPDFADPAPEVRQVIDIDAPPAVVFRTLLTPTLVAEWFGAPHAVIEPYVGGRYELGWRYQVNGREVSGGPTRILALEENRRLVLDWPDWRGDETVTGQTISFTLEEVGARTRLTFVHSGFTRTTDISDYPFGWVAFLTGLVSVSQREAA